MDVPELQLACKERGMRAFGMSEKRLKHQLEQWLELSIEANVPPSLLLLSRTLYLPEELHPTAKIAATISSLPESAMAMASTQIGEMEGKVRNVDKLELIKEEQRKIEEEEKEVVEVSDEVKDEEVIVDKAPVVKATEMDEEIVDKAPVITDETGNILLGNELTLDNRNISNKRGDSHCP